jgi:plastocyanin
MCAVAVSLVTLAACAPAAVGGSSSTTGTATTGRQAGSTATARIDPACTRATKVKITRTGNTYAFSPRALTIQRGAALAVTNRSDAVHALVSNPDAGIVSSVVDLKERQVIQFPDEGTFTVESADAAHRAVLRVTVSGESGCGAPAHKLTIVAAQSGGYAFEPAKVTLAATENFAVVNHSGVTQSVVCGKDGGADDNRLDKGETQLLAIDEPGRYTCTSVQHSSAKLSVTVE